MGRGQGHKGKRQLHRAVAAPGMRHSPTGDGAGQTASLSGIESRDPPAIQATTTPGFDFDNQKASGRAARASSLGHDEIQLSVAATPAMGHADPALLLQHRPDPDFRPESRSRPWSPAPHHHPPDTAQSIPLLTS